MLVESFCMNKIVNEINRVNENFDDRTPDEQKAALNVLFAWFVVVLLLLIVWLFTLIMLIKHGNSMPMWALVLAVLGLLFFGPVGTILALVLIYTTSGAKLPKYMLPEKYQFRYRYN